MRHVIIALAVVAHAAPVQAGQTAYWDGTGCTIHLTPGQAHVAELHCHNARTAGLEPITGYMEDGGVGVSLTVDHTGEPAIGQAPDEFIFMPDAGYWVEPPTLMIDELADGVAYVYEWTGS